MERPGATSHHEAAGDQPLVVRTVEDHRRPARGWSRLLVVALAVLGALVLAPSAVDLIRRPTQTPVVDSLDVAAGILYLLAAVCVAHNGRRMRMVGWMSLTALLTGALLFGLLTWTGTAPGLDSSVWADGGRRLAFLPLLLPAVAAVWMWMSDPRRIVVAAERREELTRRQG
ncbi:MAG: hypothetical protein E7A72_00205 [Actinomyces urogenitalis]|uniref:Uncharacterized protein n=2 Tax=Actinomyces urogenitalis TaxID=103621 RepID=C0W3U4_9ACTO|nr:hypothetical protein [Actinomyces urogenitalis]EEH66620.1 hypothetical protein HMPREF0058_0538 [Actinomyces urogenitalis DSM 15434]MBS5976028.1 hypothetical protein [Actinomyces urogenitalis]MBS6071416.1 hypothetical protein [Actinomyces urogenitalis]MDK8236733.1 hypothetical protein [Actinomyces urogenitalis]MDK8834936.1 hypothetical protein [Actinomyces urogenitalis]